ncbi:hypothetical protein GCM10009682_17690 [Luedemannella flava]|uniref:DUF1461 domain-containing protein n=1 Tax=Luedemannella flava TaxID=349316 RepID=A0ABP4Y213_9ACTN
MYQRLRRSPLLSRLLSPAGLVLAALLFGLPFLAVGCDRPEQRGWLTYSGADLVTNGAPTVEKWTPQDGEMSYEDRSAAEDMFDIDVSVNAILASAQPWSILAVGMIAFGIVAGLALRPARLRMIAGAAAALSAAVALLIAVLWAQGDIAEHLITAATDFYGSPVSLDSAREFVPIRYGFWVTFGLLIFIGLSNVYFSVPGRQPPPDVGGASPTSVEDPEQSA